MPGGRDKPLPLQSTTELWAGFLGLPAFGSLFVAMLLMGTPVSGSLLSPFGMVLLCGGFFTLMGASLGVPRLEELRRRRAWVPPGTARQPVLVAVCLVLLVLVAGVADSFVMFGVINLAAAAGLRELFAGLLGSAVALLLAGAAVLVLRRLVRRPPTSEPSAPQEEK